MKFITFEGCEASGKSTQANFLKNYIKNSGHNVCLTREPGGSVLAEEIRTILLKNKFVDPLTEYLLLAAARRDHLLNLIIPKLKENFFVISDRFYDSSLVYQGFCKNLDINIIEKIRDITLEKCTPNLTFLLDIPAEEIKKRLKARSKILTHYDDMHLDFHKKIKEGFVKLANMHKDRIVVIDATMKKKEIFELVKKIFHKRFGRFKK